MVDAATWIDANCRAGGAVGGYSRTGKGQGRLDADQAGRLVTTGGAIWYGSHFEDSAAHDWVPIKEWNGPFHPLWATTRRTIPRYYADICSGCGVPVSM